MSSNGLKRYNLALPQELFDEVQNIADENHTTVVEILKKFIKIGLLAVEVEKSPGAALLIREDDKEREIVFV